MVGVLGEVAWTEGDDRHAVVGVRTLERVKGFGEGETEVVGAGEFDGLGLLIDGCL